MRVFLSYRHEGPEHFRWVERLARDLEQDDVEVMWDESLRRAMTKHCTIDPNELPLCREISRTLSYLCNLFVAVSTPGYVERTGVGGGEGPKTIPYGVVFEEWQGALAARNATLLKICEVLRRGERALGVTRVVDFRSDDPAHYRDGLEDLLDLLFDISPDRNPLSSIDLQSWCDAYVEWSRVRFPARARAPVDVWWFHTGAANEFMGDVGRKLAEWDDVTKGLNEWRSRLATEATNAGYQLTAGDLLDFVSAALIGVHNLGTGWQHLEKTVEFCRATLAALPATDDRQKLETLISEIAKMRSGIT